ncbi:hypothetical protein [Verrucomicrobium spinosum]|uniref:hypothetical protein n=1 Tax=Verrucomicrobium spinosum TaxID=2736 RepID=UPI0001746B51|nr:hypothetical protein [Verrucomicrobium spinosum]
MRFSVFFATAALACAPFALSLGQAPAAGDLRQWTDVQGRVMQARLAGVEGDQVVFMLASGQSVKFALSRLSNADQAFIKQNGTPAPGGPAPGAGVTPPTGTRTPIEKRAWPDVVEVSTRAIEITVVDEVPAEKRCIYRSEAFEFTSEDKLACSVMKEIARTFEATRALVEALPWGIEPRPPADLGRYQAKFFATRASYVASGAPENSGGVYFGSDRTFRVPFQSLGLDLRGKTWFKDDNYRNDTIVHEITHQLMHDYLGFLPTWIIEGTAEYTESIPYNAGRFQAGRHESGLKEYIKERAERENMTLADFRGWEEHMRMTRDKWDEIAENPSGQHRAMRQLYFQSYVLVYYFCHLDGDGKGTRFMKYLDAMAEERAKGAEYDKKLAEYRKAMEEFFKLPGVKQLGGGRFSYPRELTPPPRPERPERVNSRQFGLDKLDILFDGRSSEVLLNDVKNGFKKIGIKI